MNHISSATHRTDPARPRCTVVLLDVSLSMEQTDWLPSRLEGAVGAFDQLLEVKERQYPDDYVGLVAFSDVAKMRHPLIRIGGNAFSLKAAARGIVTGPSTAITDGLISAYALLSGHSIAEPSPAPVSGIRTPAPSGAMPVLALAGVAMPDPVRQIILLTDGEHNQGPDPVPYALELKRAGVVIDVLGIGTATSLDQTSLREIASPKLDGTPSYSFIGDPEELGDEMRRLAHHHLKPLR